MSDQHRYYRDEDVQLDIKKMQAQGAAEAAWYSDEVYQSYLMMGWAPLELAWIGRELYACSNEGRLDAHCTSITLAERSNHERR